MEEYYHEGATICDNHQDFNYVPEHDRERLIQKFEESALDRDMNKIDAAGELNRRTSKISK